MVSACPCIASSNTAWGSKCGCGYNVLRWWISAADARPHTTQRGFLGFCPRAAVGWPSWLCLCTACRRKALVRNGAGRQVACVRGVPRTRIVFVLVLTFRADLPVVFRFDTSARIPAHVICKVRTGKDSTKTTARREPFCLSRCFANWTLGLSYKPDT